MAETVDPTLTRALEAMLVDPPAQSVQEHFAGLRGELKRAFAPIARLVGWGLGPTHVLQRCLELPADAPLHLAAADLLARGVHPGPVHVSVAPLPLARRGVWSLLRSKVAPVFYVAEPKGRVSVWSIETGEHLGDIAFPKASASPRALAELPDGTLRVVTDARELLVRPPGAPIFKSALKFKVAGGKSRENFWAGSDDLGLHVVKPEVYAVEGPDGWKFTLHIYDVATGKPRPLVLPADDVGEFVRLGPAQIGAVYFHDVGDVRSHQLAVIDLATASARVWPLPGEPNALHLTADQRAVIFPCTFSASDAAWVRLDLADGSHRRLGGDEIEEQRHFPRALVPLHDSDKDGLVYDQDTHSIRNRAGEVLAYYAAGPTPIYADMRHRRVLLAGPRPGWFILALAQDEPGVALIAPYEPSRAAATPAPQPLPTAPEWARRGVVLDYDIADHDVADRYRMRVVAADDGLTLKIDALPGEEGDDDEDIEPDRVVEAARFTARALEQADQLVVLSQGAADVDLETDVSERSPPCMICRAMFTRLAAGTTEMFTHPWLGADPMSLTAVGEPEARALTISGEDQRVPVRSFAGEAGTLRVIDDPRWPLIYAYDAGECHIRLTGIKLPRARAGKPA